MEINYLSLIIGGLIAFTSAVLSQILIAALNEYKTRRDENRGAKKALKSALFHQIEIYGEMMKVNQTIHNDFGDKIRVALEGLGIDPNVAKGFTKIPDELYDVLGQTKIIDLDEIGKKYESIIEKVAEVDPFLAVKISQRVRIKNRESIEPYFNNLISSAPTIEPLVFNFAKKLKTVAKQDIDTRLTNSIEESILETAKRIDKKTYAKTNDELSKLKESIANKHLDIVKDKSKEFVGLMQEYSREVSQGTQTITPKSKNPRK